MSGELPSIVDEIEWLTDTLASGFVPGVPVDGELLDRLVDHLRNVSKLAALLETELAASRSLLADLKTRSSASAASLHPQPEKMQ